MKKAIRILFIVIPYFFAGCSKGALPLKAAVANDVYNDGSIAKGNQTAACRPTDLVVGFGLADNSNLNFEVGASVSYQLNASGCTGRYKLYKASSMDPTSELDSGTPFVGNQTFSILYPTPGKYRERIKVSAIDSNDAEVATTGVLFAPEIQISAAGGTLSCSAQAVTPTVTVQKDGAGKWVSPPPHFVFTVALSSPGFLTGVDGLPLGFKVLSVTSTDGNSNNFSLQAASVFNVEIEGGFESSGFTFKVSSDRDPEKAHFSGGCNSSVQVSVQQLAPAAPNCTITIPKTTFAPSEKFVASLGLSGTVLAISLNGTLLQPSANPTAQLTSETAPGSYKVSATVIGPGGGGSCDASYEVVAPPCQTMQTGTFYPKCCVNGTTNCTSQWISIQNIGTQCLVDSSLVSKSQPVSLTWGTTVLPFTAASPATNLNKISGSINADGTGQIKAHKIAQDVIMTCNW